LHFFSKLGSIRLNEVCECLGIMVEEYNNSSVPYPKGNCFFGFLQADHILHPQDYERKYGRTTSQWWWLLDEQSAGDCDVDPAESDSPMGKMKGAGLFCSG